MSPVSSSSAIWMRQASGEICRGVAIFFHDLSNSCGRGTQMKWDFENALIDTRQDFLLCAWQ